MRKLDIVLPVYISTEKKCESEFSKGMLEQAVRELNAQVGIPAKLSDAGKHP